MRSERTSAPLPDVESRSASGGLRRRLRAFVSRRPRVAAALVVIGATLVVLGLVWFEPWQLFVDKTVNEPLPAVAAGGAGGQGGEPAPAGTSPGVQPSAEVLSTGRFRSLEHGTTGTAKVLRLSDGTRLVRLEDLRTSNGPDLIVILSDTPATEDAWGAYDDGVHVSLGELKGNIGSQNYEIPRDVDLEAYRSVVVWCRRFTVGFGAAPIR